jgi:hypothetical protein
VAALLGFAAGSRGMPSSSASRVSSALPAAEFE